MNQRESLPAPWIRLARNIQKYRIVYLMALPVLAYYILFHYAPMYGASIAFKHYIPSRGIQASAWVGLKHFDSFFHSYYFERLIRNTLLISLYSIAFGFPAPILLALLLNEVKSSWYKRTVQTITYLPHFLSMTVICGMILNFFASSGAVNSILTALGGENGRFCWIQAISVPFTSAPIFGKAWDGGALYIWRPFPA